MLSPDIVNLTKFLPSIDFQNLNISHPFLSTNSWATSRTRSHAPEIFRRSWSKSTKTKPSRPTGGRFSKHSFNAKKTTDKPVPSKKLQYIEHAPIVAELMNKVHLRNRDVNVWE